MRKRRRVGGAEPKASSAVVARFACTHGGGGGIMHVCARSSIDHDANCMRRAPRAASNARARRTATAAAGKAAVTVAGVKLADVVVAFGVAMDVAQYTRSCSGANTSAAQPLSLSAAAVAVQTRIRKPAYHAHNTCTRASHPIPNPSPTTAVPPQVQLHGMVTP